MAQDHGWKITDQAADQIQNTRAGNTVTGVIVYFITGDGNEGSVFIANQHYNVKNVRTAVEAQARLMDEVGRQGQGNLPNVV